MVAPLVAQIGIPVLVKILSGSIEQIDHPAAKTIAGALGTLEEALQKGQITPEQIAEANRHAEYMTQLELKTQADSLNYINETFRSEISSSDSYVRRMRPTFGYIMAFTWAAQMFAVAYIMVFRTSEARLVLEAIESLSMIWTVGLSVLGIYVYKRSEEKKADFMASPVSAPRPFPLKESETKPATRQESSRFNS